MKIFLNFFLICFTLQTFGFTPPNQNIVNQYVSLALSLDLTSLPDKKDKFSCQYVIDKKGLISYGKDTEKAITFLQLMCIKDQCQELESKVAVERESLKNSNENELRDLLEFQGKSSEEIESAIRKIKNSSDDNLPLMNCYTSNSFRMVAFDICIASPVKCTRR